MSGFITGLIFLLAGAGIYAFNTESHDRQLVLPGLNPDQTAGAILAAGVFFTALGAWRFLRARKAARELEAMKSSESGD